MTAYVSAEGITGIGVFLFCTFLAWYDLERKLEFQPIHMALVLMGLVYGLMFPISVRGAQERAFTEYQFILGSSDYFMVFPLSAVLAATGLYRGWTSVSMRLFKRSANYFIGANVRKLVLCSYAMAIVALVTQYLYTRDYGGFIGYFEVNYLLRSGLIEDADRSRFSFLLPFGGFAVVAFYGFWGLFLSRKRGPAVVAGLVLSGALAGYVAFASAGRVSMLALVAVIFLSVLLARKTNRYCLLVSVMMGVPLVWFLLFTISSLLELNSADNIETYIVRESSYIFVSFFAQLAGGDHFQMFRELLVAPAYLLPQSLTRSWLESATDINTRLIYGANKGEQGITGSIPVDMITFGLMQLHLFGVFCYGCIFGYVLRILYGIASSFQLDGVASTFVACVFIKFSAIGVFYAYPKHILVGNFAFVTTILCVWGIRSVKRAVSGAVTRR